MHHFCEADHIILGNCYKVIYRIKVISKGSADEILSCNFDTDFTHNTDNSDNAIVIGFAKNVMILFTISWGLSVIFYLPITLH